MTTNLTKDELLTDMLSDATAELNLTSFDVIRQLESMQSSIANVLTRVQEQGSQLQKGHALDSSLHVLRDDYQAIVKLSAKFLEQANTAQRVWV